MQMAINIAAFVDHIMNYLSENKTFDLKEMLGLHVENKENGNQYFPCYIT